jgi:uroporphyrinogen-III synthase
MMTRMVQVAIAGDVAEAEEIESMLRAAGIDPVIEPAVDHHPTATDDTPQKVLVPEQSLDAALHAIESLSDPDEIVADT